VLISLVAVSAFLSRPYIVLLPVFAETVVQPSAQPILGFFCAGGSSWLDCQSPNALIYGVLMAANGLGAVIGALFMATMSNRLTKGWWLSLFSLAFPALLIAMSLSHSFGLMLFLLIGLGFTFVAQNVLANTLVQLVAPDGLRGRIMSFYSLSVLAMTRLGGVQAGLVGDRFGVSVAVGLGALLSFIYAVFVLWRFPRLRRMA
jgi:predicted MFS family arabinose efflux permease